MEGRAETGGGAALISRASANVAGGGLRLAEPRDEALQDPFDRGAVADLAMEARQDDVYLGVQHVDFEGGLVEGRSGARERLLQGADRLAAEGAPVTGVAIHSA